MESPWAQLTASQTNATASLSPCLKDLRWCDAEIFFIPDNPSFFNIISSLSHGGTEKRSFLTHPLTPSLTLEKGNCGVVIPLFDFREGDRLVALQRSEGGELR